MLPPISTYSIVARCPVTARLGVGVQSHYFAVGAVCPWARAGVGAVVTQGFAEAAYGPLGLARMAAGDDAGAALGAVRDRDPAAAIRQVAMVDASGTTALHTGSASVPMAGGYQGDGYSVQGNMLASGAVWKEMAAAFEAAQGDLGERILCALEAGERAGGDVRGRKSAALLVVSGERVDAEWEGRLVDVRVDHHVDPLGELRRLAGVADAYASLRIAQEAFAAGDSERALAHASRARELAPDEPDLPFWTAVALAGAGHPEAAESLLADACARGEGWRELARRLRAMGFLPAEKGSPKS